MDINIDKNEILRYLGYSGQKIDENTNILINNCIEKLRKNIKPLVVTERFGIDFQDDGVKLINTDVVLLGNDITNHLKGCGECVILCATLGINVDNLIRITQNISMSEAVVLDACAVEFIEKVCDIATLDIENSLKTEKKSITLRFSPGYGDLPIEIQPDILKIVDAQRRIGLTVTDTNIMIPRKSVSAVIGISDKDINQKNKKSCESCNLKDRCKYRKRGVKCND